MILLVPPYRPMLFCAIFFAAVSEAWGTPSSVEFFLPGLQRDTRVYKAEAQLSSAPTGSATAQSYAIPEGVPELVVHLFTDASVRDKRNVLKVGT
ncbi:unnamed protein product, partial [Amoebophrya sp. A120]|eukprot:GSA120T00011727001.1